jgi:hypothetical protein
MAQVLSFSAIQAPPLQVFDLIDNFLEVELMSVTTSQHCVTS